MTKKDYELIAKGLAHAMANAKYPEVVEGVANAAIAIAGIIEEVQPRFRKAKFLVAAGLPSHAKAVMEARS